MQRRAFVAVAAGLAAGLGSACSNQSEQRPGGSELAQGDPAVVNKAKKTRLQLQFVGLHAFLIDGEKVAAVSVNPQGLKLPEGVELPAHVSTLVVAVQCLKNPQSGTAVDSTERAHWRLNTTSALRKWPVKSVALEPAPAGLPDVRVHGWAQLGRIYPSMTTKKWKSKSGLIGSLTYVSGGSLSDGAPRQLLVGTAKSDASKFYWKMTPYDVEWAKSPDLWPRKLTDVVEWSFRADAASSLVVTRVDGTQETINLTSVDTEAYVVNVPDKHPEHEENRASELLHLWAAYEFFDSAVPARYVPKADPTDYAGSDPVYCPPVAFGAL